jgi:ABC-transporter N-terminal
MSSPEADGNGISWIQKTGTEFHVPLRRLATRSSQGRGTELVLSSEKDVEKGPLVNYGPFDVRYYLTPSNEANKAAGIKPKHVGVTWEDLQVVVHGDKDCKVMSFPWELDLPSYFSIRHTSRRLTVGSLFSDYLKLTLRLLQCTCFRMVLLSSGVLSGDFPLETPPGMGTRK